MNAGAEHRLLLDRRIQRHHRAHAGPEWQHYTGTIAASVATQRAFGVYLGDKISHAAVTLLRAAPGEPWRRIDGFVTADQLLAQYHSLMDTPRQSVANR